MGRRQEGHVEFFVDEEADLEGKMRTGWRWAIVDLKDSSHYLLASELFSSLKKANDNLWLTYYATKSETTMQISRRGQYNKAKESP